MCAEAVLGEEGEDARFGGGRGAGIGWTGKKRGEKRGIRHRRDEREQKKPVWAKKLGGGGKRSDSGDALCLRKFVKKRKITFILARTNERGRGLVGYLKSWLFSRAYRTKRAIKKKAGRGLVLRQKEKTGGGKALKRSQKKNIRWAAVAEAKKRSVGPAPLSPSKKTVEKVGKPSTDSSLISRREAQRNCKQSPGLFPRGGNQKEKR